MLRLIPTTEKYFERYGYYPAKILVDKIAILFILTENKNK